MNRELIQSLNGVWNYFEDGTSELDYKAFSLLKKGGAKKMKLPINWELAGLHNFNGSVWFYKKFDFTELDTDSINVLKFYGVDYFVDVWINDEYLGHHEGYFQTFEFILSNSSLKLKNNEIVVRVTSPKEIPNEVWPYKKKLIKGIFNHHDCRPGGWSMEQGQDQNTGGIWNSIEILSGKRIYFKGIKITTKIHTDINSATILIELKNINNFSFPQNVLLNLKVTYNGKKIFRHRFDENISKQNNTTIISFKIKNPKLWNTWDLGEPNLYKIEIASDFSYKVQSEFGIRDVTLKDGNRFFINHKELFLRGTNIIPTQMLSSFDEKKIDALIFSLREANINIVRVHAHINRKELYSAFDRAGILVWQDFALQWTYDTSEDFIVNAVSQIKDMVNQYFNYPSIAVWCCHNEPGEQIKTLDSFLFDAILQEDQSRIIRIASNYEEHPYDGWYWGNMEHFASTPMGPLVTEFGAQAIPQFSSLRKILSQRAIEKYDFKQWEYHNFQFEQTFNIACINKGNSISEFIANSQEYQSKLLKTAIDFYRRKKNDGITGIFQFMFIDCWESISWSVIDFYGKKKSGFYSLKKAFQPLYVSVKLMKERYFMEQELNVDIWVINDLHQTFYNTILDFSHDGASFSVQKLNKIESNSILHLNWQENKIPLPKKMSYGNNIINVHLKTANGDVLSTNDFKISMVRK